MTVLDFFNQTHDAEEMANQILHNDVIINAFDISCYMSYFNESKECPSDCKYLAQGYEYECESFNGMCELFGEPCPYNIDRNMVIKKQIIEWLQTDIDKKI